MRAAVAAGHPATVEAGVETLAGGGTAADAAVAAALASCVAETVMTGLLGGGHAIYWDAAQRRARNLDCFVAVPGLGAERREPELVMLDLAFGAELVHYAVGPASCAVPGVPAGLDALWRAHGRLPWAQLVEPALRLAQAGVELTPAHARCLEMLETVMTMDEGGRIYSPHGRLLRAGDRLEQPGLVHALEALATEGAMSVYRGSIGQGLLELSDERGGLVTRDDLESYTVLWREPVSCEYLAWHVETRAGLSGVPGAFVRLPSFRTCSAAERVVALVDTLRQYGIEDERHTTNLVTVDAEGNACVLTTSLGLGSGDWLPGLDLHLNSMLGEAELVGGPLVAGERMESMMAPTLAFEGHDELALAIGAAGGSRLRTALVTSASGILDEELSPVEAVARPRIHPTATVVHAEPDSDEDGLAALETRGWVVRRWPEKHHYFGGVSAVTRTGAAGDPRRSGAARVLG
ncbi:MAG: gamma-glutamyltransferase [Thermoleophilia bacterium]|nr:gamma-glutamyltransferase [Thermoleophilia bacterium]